MIPMHNAIARVSRAIPLGSERPGEHLSSASSAPGDGRTPLRSEVDVRWVLSLVALAVDLTK